MRPARQRRSAEHPGRCGGRLGLFEDLDFRQLELRADEGAISSPSSRSNSPIERSASRGASERMPRPRRLQKARRREARDRRGTATIHGRRAPRLRGRRSAVPVGFSEIPAESDRPVSRLRPRRSSRAGGRLLAQRFTDQCRSPASAPTRCPTWVERSSSCFRNDFRLVHDNGHTRPRTPPLARRRGKTAWPGNRTS